MLPLMSAKSVARSKRSGNFCSGNLVTLVQEEDADDTGTPDGSQYFSRARARLCIGPRPTSPNCPRSENGREAVLDVKRQEGSVSARKRTRPDVHAATPLVARDFPR